MSDGKLGKTVICRQKIEQFSQTHEYIMNADVRELCDVSATTANRIFAELVTDKNLSKRRIAGHYGYDIMHHDPN